MAPFRDLHSNVLITPRMSTRAQLPAWMLTVLPLGFRTVVKCNIAKSQALYSAQRGLKTNNAAVFKVGAIVINIPQHPATLHSMMVRSSHQLSKQISDLIRQPSTTCVCSLFLLTTTKKDSVQNVLLLFDLQK